MRRSTTVLLLTIGCSCAALSPARIAAQSQAAAKDKFKAQTTQLQSPAAKLACAVSGTVRDKTGAVIPNASVKVIEPGTGVSHAFTADSAGHYCAFGLPAGNYAIAFERPGFRSTRLDAISVPANRAIEADVMLPGLEQSAADDRSAAITTRPPSNPVTKPVAPVPQPVPLPPAPVQPAQPVPSANPSDASGDTSGNDLGEAEAKWFDQLKNGSIQYQVPEEMIIGQPSTVSVTINGYKAPVPDQADGSQPATLKVSEFMRVEVSQVDNPGEFTIVHGNNPDQQFVPINSSATWTWTVTPNHLGQAVKLQFQAFVVYSDPKLNVQQALTSTEKTITVRAEGVAGIARNAADNFWLNPANWIKYMLPGGGGFVLLGLLIGWLRSKRKKTDPGKPVPK